jgi:signal peptidase I
MPAPADPGPASADPASADPLSTDPASADPLSTDPASADPHSTDPVSTDPVSTDPVSTGPAGAGRRRRRWRGGLPQTLITLLVAALLSVLLRTYAGEIFWVPSASMVPTLAVYDRILVQKAFFNRHDVRAGDIVVFTHPPLDQCGDGQAGDLVKRVIALPGQTIYSAGNSIYINGHLLAEPYLPAYDPLGPPIASSQHPYRVPSGEFYVLGDNRADSCDSRYWGPIQGSSIIGRAILVIWHDHHPDLRGL